LYFKEETWIEESSNLK